jgi:hypothetical protein
LIVKEYIWIAAPQRALATGSWPLHTKKKSVEAALRIGGENNN